MNLTNLLLRHSSANHERKTIAFSKRRQGVVERASVFVTWRNWMNSRSENEHDETPAEWLGVADRKLGVADVLARRLFPSRVELPEPCGRRYRRAIPQSRLPRWRRHELVRAT